MTRTLRAGLLAALAGLLPACMTDSPDDFGFGARDLPDAEGWMESRPFPCHDFDVLWETAKIQATRNGYLLDDDATSYRGRKVVTRWKTDLATSKYSGRRQRRFVEFVALPEPRDAWKVRVSTIVQRNADLDDPLNPAQAEWRRAAPDTEDAEIIAYLIEQKFREYGPSPELEIR